MNLFDKRSLVALSVAIVMHLALLLFLYLIQLYKVNATPAREQIILVDIGDASSAFGGEEPQGMRIEEQEEEQKAVKKRPILSQPTSTVKPEQIPYTPQTHEESLEIRAKKALEEKKQKEAEEKRIQEEAEKKRQVGNSIAKAFGAGKGENTNHGNQSGSGNQGISSGVPNGSFDLSGRSVISNGGALTSPQVRKAIEGKIVVVIEVNYRGEVTKAFISPRGTNIADPETRSYALQAARSTLFNPQEGLESQRGTITYLYVLRR